MLAQKLLANICIIVSFIFMVNQLSKRFSLESMKGKLVIGFGQGLIGIISMFYAVPIGDNMILDLRQIAILLAASYGGWISLVVSSAIICIGRVTLIHLQTSVYRVLLSTLLICIGSGLLSRLTVGIWKKWFYMSFYALVITSVTIYTSNHSLSIKLYLEYGLIFLCGALAAQFVSDFLNRSNEQLQTLKHHATTDALTGLRNFRMFKEILHVSFRQAIDHHEPLSCILLDIDHFKKINDTYGHQAGDEVLRQLGLILKKNCRTIDNIFRNGGEEFSVILPACPYEQAFQVAERMRVAVENHQFLLPNWSNINVTISVGIATYPDNSAMNDQSDLIRHADEGLYLAKRSGRNMVCSI